MMENCIFYRSDILAQLLFEVFSFSYHNYNSKIDTKKVYLTRKKRLTFDTW